MTPKNNIAQELRDLESSLADLSAQNTYSVPEGYFEGLAGRVLSRIRAMEAATAAEELGHLSPLLSQLPKTMPYTVPAGYFEEMESTLVSVAMYGEQEASEELRNISHLLSGLKKEMPYSVPAGYFDTINTPVAETHQPAKVVSMGGSRKWFRYAAAAVVTGVVALLSILYISQDNTGKTEGTAAAKFEKNILKEIRKTSDTVLTEFVKQFDEAGLSTEETAATDTEKEIKELLKDIPENELKQFLDETADTETSTTDEEILLLN
jgi:hypothetical protein